MNTIMRAFQERAGRASARCLAGLLLIVMSACAGPAPAPTSTIFYPPLPEIPRVQFLTTINSEDDIGGDSSGFRKFLLGTDETSDRSLVRPYAIAHEKGKLYVIDRRLGIVIIDLGERKFDQFRDVKGGSLRDPNGIFISRDGYKFVADKKRGQILVFNQRNEFSRAYGSEGQFVPVAVAVDSDHLYVVDISQNEVEILDRKSGEVVAKIGGLGRETGQLHFPTHVALDDAGQIYVTDFLNFRVQQFDPSGRYVKTIGEAGDTPGSMPRPKGIAVSRDGYLYAVDAAFELIQIFDTSNAEVLLGFGKYGNQPGGTYLPVGIDIDYDNVAFFAKFVDPNFRPEYLIYVANQSGPSKLNVYAFGEWTGPRPAGARN